jgi:hypothetical protein
MYILAIIGLFIGVVALLIMFPVLWFVLLIIVALAILNN